MAEARQRAEWARVGTAVSFIVSRNGFNARSPLDALAVIPPAFRPPPETPWALTPEERESQNRRGWAVMDRFFAGS